MELPFAVHESSIESVQTIIQQPGTDRFDNNDQQLLSSASSSSSASSGDSNSYIAASSQQTVESGYIATVGSLIPPPPPPNPHLSTINPSHNIPNRSTGQTLLPTETVTSRQQQQHSTSTHPFITPTIVALPPKQLNGIPNNTTTTGTNSNTIPVSVVTSTSSSVASKVTSMFSNFARFTTGAVSAVATTPSTTTNEKDYHSQPITSNSIPVRSSNKSSLTSTKDRGQRIISPAPSNNSSSSYDDGEDDDQDHTDNGAGDSSLSTEIIDFAYVNVTDEDEIDVWFDNHNENHHHKQHGTGTSTLFFDTDDENKSYNVDILTILLSGRIQTDGGHVIINESKVDNNNEVTVVTSNRLETMIRFIEDGNEASLNASIAKKNGNIQESFQKHSEAAKYFYNGAVAFRESKNASMANSLLLLSQIQAKSAHGLKRALKLQSNVSTIFDKHIVQGKQLTPITMKDRLRETVRGALNKNHRTEADISESTFLGRAQSNPPSGQQQQQQRDAESKMNMKDNVLNGKNPVDDMMELERELREMDMTLDMSSSIASLVTPRSQAFMKSSISDGSFMVIPPEPNSYMSSSVIWGNNTNSTPPSAIHLRGNNTHHLPPNNMGNPGPRARANRIHNIGPRQPSVGSLHPQGQHPALHPASRAIHQQAPPVQHLNQAPMAQCANGGGGGGLESSWWGHYSVSASQILSPASHGSNNNLSHTQCGGNNTKQLLRLMDTLKTLGDENAALLREVEDAEAARNETKASREQMRQFKAAYGKRFALLKEALDKFRKGYPNTDSTTTSNGEIITNPVTTSEYLRPTSTPPVTTTALEAQVRQQEKLIRKLTLELQKEKEDNKKKDAALNKYELFYKEVKLRSAQKAASRPLRVGGGGGEKVQVQRPTPTGPVVPAASRIVTTGVHQAVPHR